MASDNGFARAQADYDAQMPPEGDLEPFETRVLRAVVYLTYDGRVPEDEDDEGIEVDQSPSTAERAIERLLTPRDYTGGLKPQAYRMNFPPDNIEVVDAEYMSPEEADGR